LVIFVSSILPTKSQLRIEKFPKYFISKISLLAMILGQMKFKAQISTVQTMTRKTQQYSIFKRSFSRSNSF
jgi:hypothetical protein